ncbi:hypothetical protein Tco_0109314 [Tanacetum coccineum]
MHTVRGEGVAGKKRHRHDLSGDGVRNLATASGRGRLKKDLESSTWRQRKSFTVVEDSDKDGIFNDLLKIRHAVVQDSDESFTVVEDSDAEGIFNNLLKSRPAVVEDSDESFTVEKSSYRCRRVFPRSPRQLMKRTRSLCVYVCVYVDYVGVGTQSIERDRLIGIGAVLDNSFRSLLSDGEMIIEIWAFLAFNCDNLSSRYMELLFVYSLRLEFVLLIAARSVGLAWIVGTFLPLLICCDVIKWSHDLGRARTAHSWIVVGSGWNTPLCCNDIHEVPPHASALAGDPVTGLVSEPMVLEKCSSLISLNRGSFDVIVGMDWLSKRKFVIVCHEKVVRIPLEGDEILRVHGERTQGVVKTLVNTKTRVSYDLVIFREEHQCRLLRREAWSSFEVSVGITEEGEVVTYLRFIANFSKIVKPLTSLTERNQKYEWGVEQEEAF